MAFFSESKKKIKSPKHENYIFKNINKIFKRIEPKAQKRFLCGYLGNL